MKKCPNCGKDQLQSFSKFIEGAFCYLSCDNCGFDSDDDLDYPVNLAKIESSNAIKQIVVQSCVICGDKHRHGFDTELYRGQVSLSHRVAHCQTNDGAGGYYIELRNPEVVSE